MNLNAFFNQLKATSGRNDKIDLIKSLSGPDAEMFKRVAVLARSSDILFYITDVDLKHKVFAGTDSLEIGLEKLKAITSRQVTGNQARHYLDALVSMLSYDDACVIKRIINKDLDCGVNESTINKIWPGLIYEHPYMRCSSFNAKNLSKLKLPCYSQTKEDGLYLDIVVDGKVNLMTRNGQVVDQYNNKEKEDALLMDAAGHVLMGEALVRNDDGSYMNRKEGNGYLNSDYVDPYRVVFACWDMVPVADWRNKESNTLYTDRLVQLNAFVEKHKGSFVVVDTVVCNTVDDLLEHFKQNVNNGKEGTVAKNFNTKWADGTSSDQVKLKIEFECELEVVSVAEGTGKHAGKLGSVLCKTSDGLLTVNVGGGYSDKQREVLKDISVGKIFTVKSNDILYTEKGISLFLPRFVEVRHDKTVADTLQRVKEQRESAVELLKQIKTGK